MKKFLLTLVYVLALVTVLFNTAFSLKNYLFADIDELPQGKLVSSSVSPSGERTFNLYRVSNVLGDAVRGELVVNDGKAKNIFWQTNIKNVTVDWENDVVLMIDGVPVSADGETVYDSRRGTSLFTDGALADNFVDKK